VGSISPQVTAPRRVGVLGGVSVPLRTWLVLALLASSMGVALFDCYVLLALIAR
jgi:hypothetical protein